MCEPSGLNLRKLREAKGLTIETLAARMHTAKGHISQVERDLAQGSREFYERYQLALQGEEYSTPLLREGAPRRNRGPKTTRTILSGETINYLRVIASLTGETDLDQIVQKLCKSEMRRLLEVD